MASEDNDTPCKQKDNSGTDGGGKIGVDIPDTGLAKTAVSAAKKADRKAYNFHINICFLTDRDRTL